MHPHVRPLVLFVLAGLANFVHAAPLSFNAALELAERQSPKLNASTAQIDAARSATTAAGALPDPKVFIGVDNFPISGPDAGYLQRDAMTMQKVGFMQDVPNHDKREAREAAAFASVDLAQAQRRVDTLAVRRDTALAWLELYYLERKQDVLQELDRENTILARTVRAQIAAGRAQAADAVIPLQEATLLADRHDELQSSIAQAQAKLRQWVGPQASDGVAGEPPLFRVDEQHLREHLHLHPELQTFAAASRKAEAELDEAEAAKKSDWGVQFAYQHRAPQFGDMVSVQFTFDLPVSPATRQDPLIASKQRELDRIDSEKSSLLREHTEELESDLAEYTSVSRQLERAKQTALPLAEQKVSLQSASYEAGKGNLSDVLAARRELIEQRMRIIELQARQAAVSTRLHFAYGENTQ